MRSWLGAYCRRAHCRVPLQVLLCLWLIAACNPQPPPKPAGLEIATAIPTLNQNNADTLCETVQAQWGQDWPETIRILERLQQIGRETCADGRFEVERRLYDAYIGYGTLLEQRNRQAEAIRAYQTSLEYNFAGAEAIQRLRHLQVFTPEPPPACDADVINNVNNLMSVYEPVAGDFVRAAGRSFVLNGQPFTVYGMNYYPRDYPFERFLTQMNVATIDFELDLMQASGINTLRVFLRHEDLFICPGNGAIPIPANIERLDGLIQLAGARGYKIILVLNHDPDLEAFPLYEAPQHSMEQMAFIADRYRNEPTVMAYDLRDNGDTDYTGSTMRYARSEILTWLSQAVAVIRENAPNQLVTAGWGDDAAVTAPLVDFVSFQHFRDVEGLRQEIAVLLAETSRPVVLAAVGYSTYEMDELNQRQSYQRTFEAVMQNGLAGWIVWTAFDFPPGVLCVEPQCPGLDGPLNHYGIWSGTYFPKLALEAIHQATGVSSQQ